VKKEPPPLSQWQLLRANQLALNKEGIALHAGYFGDRPAAYLCAVVPEKGGGVRLDPIALLLDETIIEEFRTKLASMVGHELESPHTHVLRDSEDMKDHDPEEPN